MIDHFRMFAAYNGWANDRLYDAAAQLPEEERRRDVGAFFGSLMGTLNHLLVTDRIWMKRFTGEGEAPSRLDTILHEDFTMLREARRLEDQRIADWVGSLSSDRLADDFTYMTVTDRKKVTQRLMPALTHLFNHQTHHRGQSHGILSQLRHEPPSLDMIYFQRTEEGRAFL